MAGFGAGALVLGWLVRWAPVAGLVAGFDAGADLTVLAVFATGRRPAWPLSAGAPRFVATGEKLVWAIPKVAVFDRDIW